MQLKRRQTMYYDLTLCISPEMRKDANGNDRFSLIGHLGTHFDVMDKEFPLEYLHRRAIVFDVSSIRNRDIGAEDIDMSLIQEDMFVGFFTGCAAEFGYAEFLLLESTARASGWGKSIRPWISIVRTMEYSLLRICQGWRNCFRATGLSTVRSTHIRSATAA